jgi:HSP20 family molecular chaperone IbpA
MYKVNSSLYSWRPDKSGDRSVDSHWVPNTDVYVTEQLLVIKVELAGMRKEDLELTVEGSRLTITGHRPDGCRALVSFCGSLNEAKLKKRKKS